MNEENKPVERKNPMSMSVVNNVTLLSPEVLRRAADITEQIGSLQAELNELMAGNVELQDIAPRPTMVRGSQYSNKGAMQIQTKTGTKRYYSPEAREAISKAVRRRWRKQKQGIGSQVPPATAAAAPQPAPEAAPVVIPPVAPPVEVAVAAPPVVQAAPAPQVVSEAQPAPEHKEEKPKKRSNSKKH